MTTDSHQVLSERLLHWVIQAVHPQAAVHEITQLHGGMSSLVHNITLKLDKTKIKVVLRQFNNVESQPLKLLRGRAIPTLEIKLFH